MSSPPMVSPRPRWPGASVRADPTKRPAVTISIPISAFSKSSIPAPANPSQAADRLVRDLNNSFVAKTEIHPNRIVFHDADAMRDLHGVGVQLKEQKIVDHRKPAQVSGSSRPADKVAPAEEGRSTETLDMVK